MLQNINILTGPLPAETGNLQDDYRALRRYLERLVRGIELNFDRIDAEIDKERGVD